MASSRLDDDRSGFGLQPALSSKARVARHVLGKSDSLNTWNRAHSMVKLRAATPAAAQRLDGGGFPVLSRRLSTEAVGNQGPSQVALFGSNTPPLIDLSIALLLSLSGRLIWCDRGFAPSRASTEEVIVIAASWPAEDPQHNITPSPFHPGDAAVIDIITAEKR